MASRRAVLRLLMETDNLNVASRWVVSCQLKQVSGGTLDTPNGGFVKSLCAVTRYDVSGAETSIRFRHDRRASSFSPAMMSVTNYKSTHSTKQCKLKETDKILLIRYPAKKSNYWLDV